jgi:glutamate synthase (NADPH/NADH) small chain
MLFKGRWKEACQILEQTCDFPEFTGRVCPALCEKSCVLNLSIHEPVTIRENESSIAEVAFREGYIKVANPTRNGLEVAVVGSGPAGLTVANRLNRKGYKVTVYEKNELPGGLLRFGIPNFKLGKNILDRRTNLMQQEGIVFKTKTCVGKDISAKELIDKYDAVCVAIGSEVPRDLPVEGRELKGVYFALEYLTQQNRVIEDIKIPEKEYITAKGKKVLVIGGGDTGSDCVGTANRQGAKSITQIEILPQPPVGENPETPWPAWPQILKTSSSHEEGCVRRWNLTTNKFIGDSKGNLKSVEIQEVEWIKPKDGGRPEMKLSNKKEKIETDLVFLCMGFVNPTQDNIIKELTLNTDQRKNITVDGKNQTSHEKVFACGDAVSGASLVVRAMASGVKTAEEIDNKLKTKS